MADDTEDVAALFARLKEELHAAGPRDPNVPPAQVRLSIRDQAERLWPVSAERPIVGKGGPLKSFLRRLMRWYVEPAFADQRAFNDAVLKLIDDLDERLQKLEKMRVAVCAPQVPFVRGGAELMAEDLVAALEERGHEAELVSVPFKWYPGTRVLDQAFLWRLVDLTESDGRPIDRVIATKFPAYCVRHPNKVAWVLHQFRQAYDYDRTDLGQFDESPEDRATRRAVERLDTVSLGEARRVFATSRNVADRLRRFNGIAAEVLPHPPQALAYRNAEPEGFVLSVNRLDRAKRIDLLIEALRCEPGLRAVVTGEGPDRERLEDWQPG